jgi:5-(carboxyamino)imidazole ribonucleotide mutase
MTTPNIDGTDQPAPLVGVVMGSTSDWSVLGPACDTLAELEIPYEARVVSAHRTPDWLFEYAEAAEARGLRAIIAGAGGAAHLPGMLAAKTLVPVLGVPVPATLLNGVDSLLSIVQMPAGVPVGTLAIGKPGAINAALFAAQMIATTDAALRDRLASRRAARSAEVLAQTLPPPPTTSG